MVANRTLLVRSTLQTRPESILEGYSKFGRLEAIQIPIRCPSDGTLILFLVYAEPESCKRACAVINPDVFPFQRPVPNTEVGFWTRFFVKRNRLKATIVKDQHHSRTMENWISERKVVYLDGESSCIRPIRCLRGDSD
jgi:hypothetical protein